jgi:hypothetical protein
MNFEKREEIRECHRIPKAGIGEIREVMYEVHWIDAVSRDGAERADDCVDSREGRRRQDLQGDPGGMGVSQSDGSSSFD